MKLGIISDTHGNLAGWQRAWEVALAHTDLIIHCGDLLYHGPKFAPAPGYDPKGLAAALNACAVPLIVVRGNADADVDQLVLEFPAGQRLALVRMDGVQLLVAHGDSPSADELARSAARWGVQYVLTGHLHVPSVRTHEGVTLLNPGTPTYPLATEDHLRRATCATIADGVITFYDLEAGGPLRV